jgi:hypothetical protein
MTMTERKPPGTSWETWIDWQIRVATEEGAFDNLPGTGKPLPDYGPDDNPLARWVKREVGDEQISVLPPSLELLRRVESELATIGKVHDEATVRNRVAALNGEIAKVNATVVEGPPTRLSPLNVDQVVAQWRQTRSATPRIGDAISPPSRTVAGRRCPTRPSRR